MANSPQAKKRARQNITRRNRNMAYRTKMRTYLKRVSQAIESGTKEEATAAYKLAQPIIDSLTSKGIIHKNKAARHKSRLSAKIKEMT